MKDKYIIGTRDSNLALKQSQIVKEKLSNKFPEIKFEIKKISTTGDREKDKKFSEINVEGIFVREIEIALLEEEIDLAVHSFKDLPTKLPSELEVAAVIDRANPLDVLAGAEKKLSKLPEGARLGTGSLRRRSQLLAYRSDLEIIPIRGNIETRLKKIKTHNLAGVILAAAGLERLGLEAQITEYLSADICLPAARQGAVVVEIRKESTNLKRILKKAEDKNTALEVWAEHAFLKEMEAGCHAPLAAQSIIKNGILKLTAAAGELDGSRTIKRSISTKKLELNSVKKLGRDLAVQLKNAGAVEILAKEKK
ncbi:MULTISPECIES: hydroxymethylbilane synthase [Halanaerobium]|uniref:Porphobilinogen deaminase n=1 Tax=Halanaerobium congolense TaxID=54121 RepID=A0A1G6KZA4_9FIRM|nr:MULTISPECIES: hydroxymethylbilane synthase [Halanaerobium]PTX15406.1 hydroxymethylbilane synthase [Halanaerobium congolense]PXV68218.1 hydroxymethylbilane synthase [Halanaerobium congolense]TDP15568.1 hydroxymethylbilane synthase [Halanaerobium congolense]TDS35414.1 hydroxymethylbilane synthase [Halanaerobium congolense]SDC36273.1 hydroxymethylbilane synthase [Halanaerobium congolense]